LKQPRRPAIRKGHPQVWGCNKVNGKYPFVVSSSNHELPPFDRFRANGFVNGYKFNLAMIYFNFRSW